MRKRMTHALAVLAVAVTVLLTPGAANAIGDNGSCTTLYGSGSTRGRVCGDYWSVGGGLYDGWVDITSNNGWMQEQVNGGPWYNIEYRGWTGSYNFYNMRTYYVRVCTNSNGTGCSGKW